MSIFGDVIARKTGILILWNTVYIVK